MMDRGNFPYYSVYQNGVMENLKLLLMEKELIIMLTMALYPYAEIGIKT